ADLVFRNSNTDDHYVNVTGGNDRGKYFASFDYYKETGIIVGSDYKRFSGNINGSYKVKPNLEVGSGATFSTSSQFGVIGGEINTLYRNIGLWPTMNPWLDSAKTIPNPGNGITDGNPLYWLNKNIRNNEVNRITGNAFVKYDILKNLFVKLSGNIYLFENVNDGFTKATQTYGQLYTNPQGFNTTRPAFASFGRTVQKTFNGIINYTKSIGRKHNIEAMIGAESFGQKSLSTQVSGTGAPTDDITTVNASTVFAPGSNFSSKSQFRIISNFSRINYNYDNRYLLTFVHRADGISSLSEKVRWGFFPGISVGWNLHNEKFYKGSAVANVVSSVKPRISYGVNGNASGIGNYDVQGGYGSQGNYNGGLGFLNTLPVNPKLTWEKSTTTDIGLDIGILKNKVTIIFDYFKRLNSDILQSLVLPGYTGFGGITTNNGELENKGYEFTVNANILKTKSGINLDVSGNIAFVKNKITKLPFNGNENNRQGGFQIFDPKAGKVIWVSGLQEGQPLGAVYAYKQISIFQNAAEIATVANTRYDAVALISGPGLTSGLGKITPGDVNWMDVDKNDTIDSRDQVYVGNINPKFTGGFSTTLSFKGFSLYTRWDFAVGHILYNDLVTRTLGNY
ncbi:MAG TPA: TonB-dependent receptor, partial [Ferruginibacter sp.]|nr:TonB-dependent receptor [Ferruginibacter sp.]